MLDLIVRNVEVFDGSGAKPYISCLGIVAGKIVAISQDIQDSSQTVLDGTGLSLCPGFIDVHSHSDILIANEKTPLSRLSQGITSEIVGQCGLSLYPISPARLNETKKIISLNNTIFPEQIGTFYSYSNYCDFLCQTDLYTNFYTLIGHGSLRMAVMGEEDRQPTKQELTSMTDLLRAAMENGALGLSSGLIYHPAAFAKKEEIVELCKVVAEYHGVYTTHIRNEADHMLDALDEAIDIARQAGTKLNISHIKLLGRKNWGMSETVLERISMARQEGIQITMDLYPYEATATSLSSCIPSHYFRSGMENLLLDLKRPEVRKEIQNDLADPSFSEDNNFRNCESFNRIFLTETPLGKGMSVEQYARLIGKDPFDAFFDLYIEQRGMGTGVFFSIGRDDVLNFIKDDQCFIGSDILFGHPRAFGAFPEAIEQFVHKERSFSLQEMICKMSNAPARAYCLNGKGQIAVGMDADFVLFRKSDLGHNADYANPYALSSGIDSVWIAGEKAYANHTLSKEAYGQSMKRNV